MFLSLENITCLLLKELSKMFERLFMDNVDEEKMWELSPTFLTLDANIILFNAPTVVYITIPKQRTLYNLFDSGAIEMSIMAAAKEKGVDSVPAYEAIKYPDILRKHMKIGDDEDVAIGIALGYEDKENILSKIKAKKLSVDELCHFYE